MATADTAPVDPAQASVADAPAPVAPPTIPTVERMQAALSPYRDLIAWVDAMGDLGTLEQASNEAASRIAAAQRDLDASNAQLATDRQALEDQKTEVVQMRADADAYDATTKDGANQQAQAVLDKANADAAAAIAASKATLADLESKRDDAETELAGVLADLESGKEAVANIQAELASLKAKFG